MLFLKCYLVEKMESILKILVTTTLRRKLIGVDKRRAFCLVEIKTETGITKKKFLVSLSTTAAQ